MSNAENRFRRDVRTGATAPMYPLSYMYQAGGLYYYASSCCSNPPPYHTGLIASETELATLGCSHNPVKDAALNLGLPVPHPGSTESPSGAPQSRSLGVLFAAGSTWQAPDFDVFAAPTAIQPTFRVRQFSICGDDPVVIVDADGNPLFAEGRAFVIRLVSNLLDSRPPLLIAHPVSIGDVATFELRLSGYQVAAAPGAVLQPHTGTLANENPYAPHWEVMIVNSLN